jgi:glutamate formiminotransferase/glutamate formiminotransferase/formiminotetrahydrofolate cyclodeaminase
VLECVINVSEGRRTEVVERLAAAAGPLLLDTHSDPHHNRSVLTLAGPVDDVQAAARAVTREGVASIDLRMHHGVHPRLGAVDVVPFVPLGSTPMATAVAARDAYSAWAAAELQLPCFHYGSERSLPDVRRLAFHELRPDAGPDRPHPTAGATAVGARPVLVAYNVWLGSADVDLARTVARSLRSEHVRALGLLVGDRAQVSCNLLSPAVVGPDAVYDAVAATTAVAGAELVGLVPADVFEAVPAARRAELDLERSRTIEARLKEAGLDGGST